MTDDPLRVLKVTYPIFFGPDAVYRRVKREHDAWRALMSAPREAVLNAYVESSMKKSGKKSRPVKKPAKPAPKPPRMKGY